MSYVALAGLVRRGVVVANDEVSSDGRQWQQARSVPGLFDSADAPGTRALARKDQPGTDRHRPGTDRVHRSATPHPGAGIPGTGSHTRKPGTARFADNSKQQAKPAGRGSWGIIIAVIAVLAVGAGGFIWWQSRPHPIVGTWTLTEHFDDVSTTTRTTYRTDGTFVSDMTTSSQNGKGTSTIEADYFIVGDVMSVSNQRVVKWPAGGTQKTFQDIIDQHPTFDLKILSVTQDQALLQHKDYVMRLTRVSP